MELVPLACEDATGSKVSEPIAHNKFWWKEQHQRTYQSSVEYHREQFLAHCYFCYSSMACQTASNQAHDSLQDDLNKLAAWNDFPPGQVQCDPDLKIKKTAPMNYTLKGHVVQNEDYTRYLGVELQSNLSWNRHIDQIVKRQIACWDSETKPESQQ